MAHKKKLFFSSALLAGVLIVFVTVFASERWNDFVSRTSQPIVLDNLDAISEKTGLQFPADARLITGWNIGGPEPDFILQVEMRKDDLNAFLQMNNLRLNADFDVEGFIWSVPLAAKHWKLQTIQKHVCATGGDLMTSGNTEVIFDLDSKTLLAYLRWRKG